MWQTINIAAASFVGVAVASIFGRNALVLCLSPIFVCLLEGGLVWTARWLSARAAEASVWAGLSSPLLMVPVLVAYVTGMGMAALMLASMQRGGRQSALWLPDPRTGPKERNWRMRHWTSDGPPAPPRAAPETPSTLVIEPAADVSAWSLPLAPFRPVEEAVVNKRRNPRRRAVLAGVLLLQDGMTAKCTVRDLSVSGARLRVAAGVAIPRALQLIDLSNGIGHDAVVMWRDGENLGVRFIASADLRTDDSPATELLRRVWRSLAAPSPRAARA